MVDVRDEAEGEERWDQLNHDECAQGYFCEYFGGLFGGWVYVTEKSHVRGGGLSMVGWKEK